MRAFVEEAKKQNARVLVFPEMAYFTGKAAEWKPLLERYPALVTTFSDWAREMQIALIPGTLREPVNAEKYYNTLLFLNPKGETLAQYRKIFLYQAALPDRNYHEAKYCEPGTKTVALPYEETIFGFAVCFDLRFPEVFRSLKRKGAQVVFLPSAFTVPTGTAHWEPLTRARSIENQFFLVAPGLTGTSGDGAATYGHSLVIGPWGDVKSQLGTEECLQTIDISLNELSESAQKVSAWDCRREDLFPIA